MDQLAVSLLVELLAQNPKALHDANEKQIENNQPYYCWNSSHTLWYCLDSRVWSMVIATKSNGSCPTFYYAYFTQCPCAYRWN